MCHYCVWIILQQSCQNNKHIHNKMFKSTQNQHFLQNFLQYLFFAHFPSLLHRLWEGWEGLWAARYQVQPHLLVSWVAHTGSSTFSAPTPTACQQIHWKGKAYPNSHPGCCPSMCGSSCPPQFISCPQAIVGGSALGAPFSCSRNVSCLPVLRTVPPRVPQNPNPAPSVSHFWWSPPCYPRDMETVWFCLKLLFALRSLSHMLMNCLSHRADPRAEGVGVASNEFFLVAGLIRCDKQMTGTSPAPWM